MFDCIIIGGGIIGMLTARELRLAGMTVLLLERGRTGRESSWAGGGIISPLYPWRYPDAVTALASWSQRHYPELSASLAESTGIDPEWKRDGLLILSPGDTAQAIDWGARQDQPVQLVGRQAIRELEPALGQPPESAIWLPEVAQIRNPRLAKALRKELERIGVMIQEGVQVDEILQNQGRVLGVRTPSGRINSGQVLLSAGAWSGGLLQTLGIELAVAPVRGQMILFRAPTGLISRITLQQDRYAIPRKDGRVLFGSTLELTGFQKETTNSARTELWEIATRMFPGLEKTPIEHHWAGLRPGSPDGIPFITPSTVSGLFINAGHFRNGVVLGPASARLMADIMLQRDKILPSIPYALQAAR